MPIASDYLNNRSIRTASGFRVNPSAIVHETFTAPATIVTNGFSVSHAGQAAAGTVDQTLGGSLCTGGVGTNDFARNVVITVTHASSVVAMSGVITGTDAFGNVITEAWSVTATGTSKTYTGKKAFKTVTSITETVAADASANSIISGNGKVLGLSAMCSAVEPIAEEQDGAKPTAGVLIVGAGSSATADWSGTYTPNATLNSTIVFDVWYVSDRPEGGR